MVTITHDEFGTVEAEDMKSAQKKLRALEREHKKQENIKLGWYDLARLRSEAQAFRIVDFMLDTEWNGTFRKSFRINPVTKQHQACTFTDDDFAGARWRTLRIETDHGTFNTTLCSETGEFLFVTNGSGYCIAIALKENVYHPTTGAHDGTRDMFYAVGAEQTEGYLTQLRSITAEMFYKRDDATV